MSVRGPWAALRRAVHHTRTGLALKTAVAATLAWVVALRLPGPAQDYPYYAPLGAVVAMWPTIATSVRQSVQGAVSIALGGAIAVVVDALVGPGVLVVAVVVLLGSLAAGLRVLGDQRTYVPTTALFVLVIGGHDDLAYAAAYAGLFALGAAIAVGVNAAFPALPLHQVDVALEELRTALDVRLRYLAGRFAPHDAGPPDPGREPLTDVLARARNATRTAVEAARGNRRAHRRPDAVSARGDAFRALERVALLVEDLYDLLADAPWGHDVGRTADVLREPAARALVETAAAVADVGVRPPDAAQRTAVDAAIRDLTRAVRTLEAQGGDAVDVAELLVMSTLTTTLRRCLSVVTPPDQLTASLDD